MGKECVPASQVQCDQTTTVIKTTTTTVAPTTTTTSTQTTTATTTTTVAPTTTTTTSTQTTTASTTTMVAPRRTALRGTRTAAPTIVARVTTDTPISSPKVHLFELTPARPIVPRVDTVPSLTKANPDIASSGQLDKLSFVSPFLLLSILLPIAEEQI